MARSVPDDDMMENQQALDLGHPTTQPGRDGSIRLPRRLTAVDVPYRESEIREIVERAAYANGRRVRARAG